MAIKAVIFDCFGVLVTDGWHPFKFKYFGDDPEKEAEATKLNRLANSGSISYQEFLTMVGELAGVSSSQVQEELSRNSPNLELFEYIEKLKTKGMKIGILSNAAANWLYKLFTTEQLELIDESVLSCDVGVNKPDKLMYETIAKKLGVEMSECLFIDDVQTYTEAAKQYGMQALHYIDPNTAVKEIENSLRD